MSAMIERVARALCVKKGLNPDARNSAGYGALRPDDPSFVSEWLGWTDLADAAIAAMREPTQAMERAGCQDTGDNPSEIWKLMIDEALK